MKNRYYFFLILGLLLYTGTSNGQNMPITGTITDENGETLPGVTVQEKGTNNGIISDINGQYKLNVANADAILQFSSVGFETLEVPVGNQSVIEATLQESYTQLAEVVVIGYGTQKKKVLTGSIESISADEITLTPVVRVDQALQGRAAGVQMLNQSGQPGERPSIKIRGIGTDYNSEPLFLVDGIAVNSIDNISPGDIASVEVLKDAASASIYGARAANGVVLITTKTGSSDKFSVTYSGYYGVQNAIGKVDLLNGDQYIQLMAEAGATNLSGRPFDANEVPPNNTDWQEELFSDNVPIESHEVSISGGNEKSTFASSVSYFKQHGIIGDEKSKFERYTARLNSKTRVNKVFSWGNTLSYARIETRGVVSNGSFNGAYSSALNIDPLTAVYEDDPNILTQVPYRSNPFVTDASGRAYAISSNIGGEIVNPLARLEIQNRVITKDQILGSLYAEAEPIERLKLRTSVGMDLSYLGIDEHRDLFYLTSTTNNTVITNLSREIQKNVAYQSEHTANYTYTVGEHKFNGLIGASTLVTNWENLTGGGQGVDTNNPDLIYLRLTVDSTQTSGGRASQTRRASVFSRLLYDYKDRVSFSATYRRDGSSNFGSNNSFGNFWSFGASWVINEEPFFPDIPAMNFLKLRASWGQNGNDNIRSFAFASLVDFTPAYNFQNGTNEGATPEFVENEDIKWESSEQLNIGIESGFFENRLTATVDYYKKTTNDLLQKEIGLASIGVPLSFANVGIMRNEGVEISLEWRNKHGDLNYSIGFNGAYNKNTMVNVANEAGFIVGANWALAGEVTRTVEGHPVTSFFGFKTDGIFQSQNDVFAHISSEGLPIQPNAVPGDIRFVDVNGDGRITDADRTIIGSPIPDWTIGSNISIQYKNFTFYALFTGQLGNEIFNGINRPDITTSNRQTKLLDRWTETNPSTSVPRFTVADPNQNYTRATDLLNIEDGSYVRLKNVQVGYNMPKGILEKFKCEAWNVYVSFENLLTFTSYTGPDPEVGAPVDFEGSGVSSIRDMGIDRGIYPQARTMRIGTSITF